MRRLLLARPSCRNAPLANMAFFIEIIAGRGTGSRYFVDSGQTVTVGGSTRANVSFPSDPFLSDVHCSFEGREQECILRDLGSLNGTFVNDERVYETKVYPGDRISVGSLQLAVAGDLKFGASEDQTHFLTFFRSMKTPLFCLLDAAHGRDVFEIIQAEKAKTIPTRIQCLYDGASAGELAAHAPYLVEFSRGSALLDCLLDKGWGESWASYLTTRSSFEELRRHFRKFLLVRLDNNEEAYFRFYDPRVLSEFLPTCNEAELAEFFGPVEAWFVEQKEPGKLVRFQNQSGKLDLTEFKIGHTN